MSNQVVDAPQTGFMGQNGYSYQGGFQLLKWLLKSKMASHAKWLSPMASAFFRLLNRSGQSGWFWCLKKTSKKCLEWQDYFLAKPQSQCQLMSNTGSVKKGQRPYIRFPTLLLRYLVHSKSGVSTWHHSMSSVST